MIQLRGDRMWLWRHARVCTPRRRVAAVVREMLGMAAHSLRQLLQSGAGEFAQHSGVQQPGRGAASQQSHFEQWFARYQLPLLDYLFGMTRDREWAADLVQETFLHAYAAARHDPTAIKHPQAWLYRIATNIALSALRRRRRLRWLPLGAVEPTASASSSDRWCGAEIHVPRGQDVAATVAERDAIWSVLAELPPRWRAVLLLQTTGGFEVHEIASELGISEANTRKILFRAKERFRQIHARLEAEAEERGGLR